MTHDELLATVQFNKQTLESSDRNSDALRAVVELTMNLQDTEAWQDDADYNAGYNNAMGDIERAIKEHLK